ncbi:MAG: helix-hairpin-helix domain-containing protein, partial [Bacillota bacterium]
TIKKTDRKVVYTIVNEAGASVYSASPLAKKEFPNLEVEERSAVSIARRLQDPLSELVKIDPKSIGVGQYQHDVNQSKLSEALDFTVETAVNKVGVDANVASTSLLNYVSGLNSRVAANIVAHREENGAFTNRKQLKKVKGIGAKSYEQSIGFLRITDGDNPLDKTSIHPESYDVAKAILKSVDADLSMIGTDALREKIRPLRPEDFTESTGAGVPTLKDIFESLMRPLRDPRDDAPEPILKSDVLSLEDLKPGMKLKGTVRNVVDFGAFVDCGVKEDGLVHISKLAKRFVKNPMDVVQVGDVVDVWVENVDIERGRLQLSMVDPSE